MKPDHTHALVLFLENESFFRASDTHQCLVLNATLLPNLPDDFRPLLLCEQGFRPEYLRLENAGYQVSSLFNDAQECKTAIVLAGKTRKVNERNIIRAWNNCEADGSILVAGNKNAGITSLRKWVGEKTDIEQSFSKYHSVVFSIRKDGDNWTIPEWETRIDDYRIEPGMFSADGPDAGSKLLTKHFDNRIKGKVADLGAGWGYLSGELLAQSENITSIDLFEADYQSLIFAEKNISLRGNCEKTYHWCDVVTEFPKSPYDWVIMNPPFHSGRAAEPELGKRFIQVAASTLPSGGRLLMVANRNLPYEKTLDSCFRKVQLLEERDGFKVIEASK